MLLQDATLDDISKAIADLGYCAVIFTPDDAPEYVDYSEAGGKEEWFSRQIRYLEQALARTGYECLQEYASADGLPDLSEDAPEEAATEQPQA